MVSNRPAPVDETASANAACSVGLDREDARLEALARYDILDTPSEEAFDRITRLAKKIFHTPMVTVTLVDAHRQWFKSRQGMDAQETPRSPSFCHVTVARGEPLIITDTALDPQFMANRFVVGEPRVRFYAGAPLTTPDGHVIGALCVMDRAPRNFSDDEVSMLVDLAQIVIDELELRRLVNVDTLTGALSRRAFRDEARRSLRLAARHRHELSVVALDLDHFKVVNDTYGHAVGDAVLARSVAACLRQLRTSDIIGRVGGEEFAVLLPHTGSDAALEVAERLRHAIAAEPYAAAGAAFSVTASFGVASRTRGLPDVDVLLRAADKGLYRAKAAGRDRCVLVDTAEHESRDRLRMVKGGRILFNKRMSTLDCTIHSLSASGAGLDVRSAVGLPETFELSIEADNVVRACRLVASSGRRVEVEFA